MKKFFIGFGIAFLLALVFQFFTSWWSLPIIIGLVALFMRLPIWQGLVTGVVIGFLLWGGFAFWIDKQNAGQLSARIGELFNGISGGQVILVSAIIGALSGLAGGFIGSALAAITRPTVMR
ncbi:MAG: hypothetical protein KDC24_11150 [Saprospiraceae bacterium]|nr:hypothetical protein [Saprospiraceae bacterium]